jgi:hypothetical protein
MKFKFYTPIEIRKAKDENGKNVMRLGGIASTKDKDADGEYLDPSGFVLDEFKTVGLVNWHHQAKNSPKTIIGEPHLVEIRKDGLYVETDLYPSSELAQEVYELAQVMENDSKTRRLGYSIEGVVLERESDNENDPGYKKIKKALITGLAITHMPKNAQTFAQIIKGHIEDEEDEETEKSLNTQSAEPVIPESVDGKVKKNVITKSNYKIVSLSERDMYLKIFNTFSDINIEKAQKFYEFLTKINSVMTNKKITDENIQKAMSYFGLDDNEKNPFLVKAENESENLSPEEVADLVQKETFGEDDEKKKKVEKGNESKKDSKDNTETLEKGEKSSFTKGHLLILKKTIEKAQQVNSIENKALATLVKATMDENKFVKSQINDLKDVVDEQKTLIKALSSKIARLSSISKGRKSIVKGYSEKETFTTSQVNNQGNVLSISQNKAQILDLLDNFAFNKGGMDEEFSKAVISFESSGVLPKNVISRLKMEKNIIVVD